MKRLFVFAIGGTGARVMRALTMLISAGELSDYEVVPIMLDFDIVNGNLEQSLYLMKRYCEIRGQNTYSKYGDFFSSPLTSINEIANNTNSHLFTIDTSVNHHDMRVCDLIEYHTFHRDDSFKQLLDSLFITTDWHGELLSDLCGGFCGNAKIARIGYAALRIQDSPEFMTLLTHIDPFSDKIVIIGSTFGGTGSAGVIEILKQLKHDPIVPVDKMNLATVLVEPYFSPMPNHFPIDYQKEFNRRSQDFFNYFHQSGVDSIVNSLYRIGMDGFLVVENTAFGHFQQNTAHPVELLSAMAICEYALTGQQGQFDYYFGRQDLQFGHESIELHDFYQMPGGRRVFESLTKYLLAAFFIKEWSKNNPLITRSYFYDEIQGRLGLKHIFIVELDRMFSECLKWIRELSSKDLSNKYMLNLFDVNAPMGEIVKGYQYYQHRSAFYRIFHHDILRSFIDRMNQNYNTLRHQTEISNIPPEQVLFRVLSDSSRDIFQQFNF